MIDVQEAIERLVAGEVIGYPTETFYGLAVDPSNKSAVRKLLELKNRSLTEGIPLIAKDSSLVDSLVLDLNDLVRERRLSLQSSFWPGPLTIVFETNSYARDIISDGVFGPQKTLAVRVSSLELALELARNSPIGFITSTSANPRGESPPSSVEEVKNYFPNMYVIEGDTAQGHNSKQPSTLVKTSNIPFSILRQGDISKDLLANWDCVLDI